MATETTQNPQDPQPPMMDVAEVYRTLGRLEAGQAQLEAGHTQINQRIDRLEQNTAQQFIEVNRRIDRLTYTIIGVGAALIIGLVLQSVFGG